MRALQVELVVGVNLLGRLGVCGCHVCLGDFGSCGGLCGRMVFVPLLWPQDPGAPAASAEPIGAQQSPDDVPSRLQTFVALGRLSDVAQ